MTRAVVLFDIDGTLIDTCGAGVRAMSRALRETFGWEDGLAGVAIDGHTDTSILRRAMRARGEGDAFYDRHAARVFDGYVARLAEELRAPREISAKPGVPELVAALGARPDCVVGLLTGNIRRGAATKLGAFGLWDPFPFGAFGDDAERRPDLLPVAMRRAAEHAGSDLAGARVVVVGDTPHDVEVAKVHGVFALAVATGKSHGYDELERLAPDALFRDLSDTRAVLRACGVE